tara:strand:+ start:1086 stop:1520 length:435 start_codon:yes stop_codon:yes gene_type:complete
MYNLKSLINRIQVLHGNEYFSHNFYKKIIENYTGDDWKKYIRINTTMYNREKIFSDKRCSLWVMTWQPKQQTNKHNHINTDCFFRVLNGELQEYKPPQFYKSSILSKDKVYFVSGSDTHILKNNSPLIVSSLHLYVNKENEILY